MHAASYHSSSPNIDHKLLSQKRNLALEAILARLTNQLRRIHPIDLQRLYPRLLAAHDPHRASRALQRLGDQFLKGGIGRAIDRRCGDAFLQLGPTVLIPRPSINGVASAARGWWTVRRKALPVCRPCAV